MMADAELIARAMMHRVVAGMLLRAERSGLRFSLDPYLCRLCVHPARPAAVAWLPLVEKYKRHVIDTLRDAVLDASGMIEAASARSRRHHELLYQRHPRSLSQDERLELGGMIEFCEYRSRP